MTNHQTTTDEPVVITEGLTKHFGDFVAVADFDLQVKEGSVVSLLGPNGAGKTTIVRMLATLSEPTSGTARVCGYDVVRDADKVRSVLSLTGQFAALEDNLTAQENLLLMARLRGYSKASSQRIVEGLIDRFDIGEFREKLIKSVSVGSDVAWTSRRVWSSSPGSSSSTSPPRVWTRAVAKSSGRRSVNSWEAA